MVAPALVWPGFDAAATPIGTPARRRLRGVRAQPPPGLDALALCAAALGIAAPPEAPLARLGEKSDEADERWFRAEPVMLIPDRDRLALARLGDDPLTAAEADALIAATRTHFADADLRLEHPRPGVWYARAPALAGIAGTAPEAAERVGVDAAMGAAPAGGAGARLLNEVQMLWHAHPVNAARRAAGRRQANALWLWGAGTLPPAPQRAAGGALIGSDVLVRGLAAWLGCAWAPLGTPDADAPGAALVVIGRGEEALGVSWLDALARRRSSLRVLAAAAEWRVPRRLLRRW